MKRLLLTVLGAGALCTALHAVPIDCTTLTTVGALISSNVGGGCFVQDKLFTDFIYTGGGAVSAANVGATVVLNVLPNIDIHGFVFAPTTTVWTTGFTLGYTISVVPPSLSTIVASKLQMNAGVTPGPNTPTVQMTESGLPTLTANFTAVGNESDVTTFPGVTSTTVLNTASFASGGILVSLENNFQQETEDTPGVPEPGTFALLSGVGLIGLALWARKRNLQ